VLFIAVSEEGVELMDPSWLESVWAAATRGKVPVAFALNPAQRDLAQPVLEWVYGNATVNDTFVALGPAANNVVDGLPAGAVRTDSAVTTAGYMASLGMETWAPYVSQTQVSSVVRLTPSAADGAGCWGGSTSSRWLETVPILGPRITIWGAGAGGGTDGGTGGREVGVGTGAGGSANPCASSAAAAAAVLNMLPKDSTDPDGGFSVVPIRVSADGAVGVGAAAETVGLLHAGVQAVNPFVFFTRLAKARVHREQAGMQTER
jgi:hypothetical protein